MSKIILFLVILFLANISCTKNKNYNLNPQLLKPWSVEAQNKELFRLPYVVRFDDGKKRVSFVAAFHANSSESQTFKLINKEYGYLKPLAVIIEGIESQRGFSHPHYVKAIKDTPQEELFRLRGEPFYAAYLANRDNVPFTGAEPSDKQIKEGFIKAGGNINDLAFLYITRQIPQLQRQGKSEKEGMEFLFGEFLKHQFENMGLKEEINIKKEDLIKWYELKNKKKFDFITIPTDVAAPLNDDSALYTQKLNFQVNYLRNKHIITVISDVIKKYDRVLIVYGGGHFVQMRDVMIDLLGTPKEYYNTH